MVSHHEHHHDEQPEKQQNKQGQQQPVLLHMQTPTKMVWKPRRKQQRSTVPVPTEVKLRSCLKGGNSTSERRSLSSSNQQQPSRSHSRLSMSRKGWTLHQDNSSRSGCSSRSSKSSRKSVNSMSTNKMMDNLMNADPSVSTSSDSSEASRNRSRNTASSMASGSSSQRRKRLSVRFGDVQMRSYERVVGDNPSCSSGPPIGLGWGYSTPCTINLESYEEEKLRFRRSQGQLVLSREQREKILTSWGISFNEIVDAIRSNIKVKSQRRQTITNLGKMQRIEEAFESATRKLKRTLLLQRRTGDKVKQLQEQATLAAKAFSQLKVVEERTLSEIRSPKGRVETEPENDDQLRQMAVQVEVANFCRTAPMESCVRSVSDSDTGSVADGNKTVGERTTPSVQEMERFHRELEMEMFGEDDMDGDVYDQEYYDQDDGTPPSMIGQTLDPCDYSVVDDDITMAAELRSVAGRDYDDNDSDSDQGDITIHDDATDVNIPLHYYSDDVNSSAGYESTTPSSYDSSNPSSNQPLMDAISTQTEELSLMPRSFPDHIYHSTDEPPQYDYPHEGFNVEYTYWEYSDQRFPPTVESFYNPYHAEQNEIHPSNFPDSDGDDTPTRSNHSRDLRKYDIDMNLPSYDYENSSTAHYDTNSVRQNSVQNSAASSTSSSNISPDEADEPKICHIPPPSYLTPTHWMEGGRPTPGVHRTFEPVTITEDSGASDDFLQTQRPFSFPASFY